MLRSPQGKQDCSSEGGATGGVVQESRMETAEKSWIVSSPSVTLLRVKLEVLHDVTEGLFVFDDPDD